MGPDGGSAQVRAEFDPIGGLLCAVAGRPLPVVSEVAQAVNSSRERAGSPGRSAPLSGQRPTAAFISGSCRSRSSSIASSCPHAIADEISGHRPSGCLLRPPGGKIHNTISMTYRLAVLFGLARHSVFRSSGYGLHGTGSRLHGVCLGIAEVVTNERIAKARRSSRPSTRRAPVLPSARIDTGVLSALPKQRCNTHHGSHCVSPMDAFRGTAPLIICFLERFHIINLFVQLIWLCD
jgi:hypothetical protein